TKAKRFPPGKRSGVVRLASVVGVRRILPDVPGKKAVRCQTNDAIAGDGSSLRLVLSGFLAEHVGRY
ncbi:TPA: hypothetical protein ACP312_006677, partial [Pseudomonas aeruginosa]